MVKSYCADFETTVYGDKFQEETEVWSASIAEVGDINPDHVSVFHSIDEFMTSFKKLGMLNYNRVNIYFHNLRFDGSFILNWLLQNKKHAVNKDDTGYYFTPTKNLTSSMFTYLVSDRGVFYNIVYKLGHTTITFLDSAKLIPMKLRDIGLEFNTRYKKLEMEYTGFRYAGCKISDTEMRYIKNDVLCASEAMHTFLVEEGHSKSTIGSNCLADYQKMIGGKKEFYKIFPKLEGFELPNGMDTDEYVRNSYKGGWCICWRDGVKKNGVTLDVNSEYPFIMDDFKLPYGEPKYHSSNDKIVYSDRSYFFVRIKCNFKLKKGKLPTIQIKNNPFYQGNEWLKTSYFYDKKNDSYKSYCYIGDERVDSRQTLTLSELDYKLFLEHYDVFDFEIVDWVEFEARKGIFSEYVKNYYGLKSISEGGKRVIYKLFLNNLYGKLGTNSNSSFKVAHLENGVIRWEIQEEKKKPTYHVACASAITSGARYYTIASAQKNYKYFCYADTDSIHLNCHKSEVKNVLIDNKKLGAWKCELEWDIANFVRQKTYVEIKQSNKGYIQGHDVSIACCSMGENAQKNVEYALKSYYAQSDYDRILIESEMKDYHNYKKLDMEFIQKGMPIEDFTHGLIVKGNLKSKQIKGGVLLYEDVFEMK